MNITLQANCGHAVTQLVEALRYKPQGLGVDSRWCQRYWLTLQRKRVPGIFPGGKGGRCV